MPFDSSFADRTDPGIRPNPLRRLRTMKSTDYKKVGQFLFIALLGFFRDCLTKKGRETRITAGTTAEETYPENPGEFDFYWTTF